MDPVALWRRPYSVGALGMIVQKCNFVLFQQNLQDGEKEMRGRGKSGWGGGDERQNGTTAFSSGMFANCLQ